MGKLLCMAGRLRHVHIDHHFRDERLFYRFHEPGAQAAESRSPDTSADMDAAQQEPDTMLGTRTGVADAAPSSDDAADAAA